MARNPKLSTIESALRSAVTSGIYAEATRLLSSYSKQLETELQNGAFQSDQLEEEMSHTSDLFDWVFRMVSAAKSHDSAHLIEVLTASSYRRSGTDRLHSWQLDG
jgi:hypothetical protein